MAQASYPWQISGRNGNGMVPTTPPPSTGDLGKAKKRKRTSHGSTTPDGLSSRKWQEKDVIVIDDIDPPPQRTAGEQAYGIPYGQSHKTPSSLAGTQHHPLELDASSPPTSKSPHLESDRHDSWPPHEVTKWEDVPSRPPPPPLRPSHEPSTLPGAPATDVVPIVEPTLCPEQAELVDLILSGRNVFYTGSAGCGKSTVLKAFVKRFEAQRRKVNIVAPTGRAALDINGSTTWTYAGWTPDSHKKPLKELRKAAHGKFVRQRLQETHVLVIDEISMVENLHLERLNAVMKEARGSDAAFGGVQLVVTGDFCQLPPVKPFGHCIECGRELIKNRQETEYKCRMHGM